MTSFKIEATGEYPIALPDGVRNAFMDSIACLMRTSRFKNVNVVIAGDPWQPIETALGRSSSMTWPTFNRRFPMPEAKPMLSDAEVICEFMEPRPDKGPYDFRPWRGISPDGWWRAEATEAMEMRGHLIRRLSQNTWHPTELTLDRLHGVEARLTDEQWPQYRTLIQESAEPSDTRWSRILLHASAEQKIAALRPVVIAALASALRESGEGNK